MRTIVVGIPVFNEAENIPRLLKSIEEQELIDAALYKIIIYDDGSTDDLAAVVDQIELSQGSKNLLHYHRSEQNHGKATGLNYIFANTSPDQQLIVLDSDMILEDRQTFKHLLAPLKDKSIGLTNGWYKIRKQNSPLYNVLDFSSKLLVKIGKARPLFVCSGAIMAFNGRLASGLVLPKKLHRIDAFLYLTTLEAGFNYYFNPEVLITDPKELKGKGFSWFRSIQKRSTTYPEAFSHFDQSAFKNASTVDPAHIILCIVKLSITHPLKGLTYLLFKTGATILNAFERKQLGAEKYLWRA